ncbi:MAG TPA: PAS domain S-box protein, partial [Rectinemataceae bacterium]|nr:PAS domain S-box protein [Rectinemataceae bacterium]
MNESQLFMQEDLFSAAFMSAPDIIAISGVESGVYLQVNEAFLETFGLEREATIGRLTSYDIGIWVDDSFRDGLIATLRERGRVRNVEVSYRVKGGELRLFSMSAGIVVLGGEDCLVSVSRDITERKLMEEGLWKSRLLLERAEEMANIGSWEVDYSRALVTASPGAHRIYGLEGEQIRASDVEAAPLPEDRPRLDRARDELILKGIPYDIEFKVRRRSDGRILDIHSRAVWDAEKRKLFGIIRDITDQKRAEEELKRLNLGLEERVAARTAELERAQGELVNSEKMAALGQLMAGIAHELNSPLGAIGSSSGSAAACLASALAEVQSLIGEAGPEMAEDCLGLLACASDPARSRSLRTSAEERAAKARAAIRLGELGLTGPSLDEAALAVARTGIEELPELLAPFFGRGLGSALRAAEGLAS